MFHFAFIEIVCFVCYIYDTDTWQLIVEDNFSHAEETVRVRKCAELCRLGLWCTGALLAESCGVLLCVCMCVCVCVGAGVSVFGVMFSIMYAMCNVMCIQSMLWCWMWWYTE